jgi:uncharacterized protein
MTLYLDTSVLVKLYLVEPDSDELRRLVMSADVVATSAVSYAEARATFARRRAERLMSRTECADAAHRLDLDWSRFFVIRLSEELAMAAGRLADTHGIRGSDAVHLAAFESLLAASGGDDVHFSCADERLTRAAATLG